MGPHATNRGHCGRGAPSLVSCALVSEAFEEHIVRCPDRASAERECELQQLVERDSADVEWIYLCVDEQWIAKRVLRHPPPRSAPSPDKWWQALLGESLNWIWR